AETDPPKQRHWFHIVDVEVRGRPYPSIAEIQDAVAKHYRITRNDICSARRTKNVVMPRMVAAYLCKLLTPLSLPTIGRKFGGRDHTTILHAVRKLTRLVRDDAAVARDVAALIRSITGTARPPA
ncbi:helix-turn-helix domain-containing protein, partial [Bradyrhizobium sp.]|uniref:helix-turn-helix domain-containing protein n=1 Tax=Bradyrhizobium sp. TaxID=376 RepID=UPI003C5DE338